MDVPPIHFNENVILQGKKERKKRGKQEKEEEEEEEEEEKVKREEIKMTNGS